MRSKEHKKVKQKVTKNVALQRSEKSKKSTKSQNDRP